MGLVGEGGLSGDVACRGIDQRIDRVDLPGFDGFRCAFLDDVDLIAGLENMSRNIDKIVVVACPNPAPALGSECCPTQYPATCDYSSGQGVPGAGGSDAGFAPLPGTTSATGGTGGGDATRGSADASSTGARGASDTTSGAGATGATGANVTCITCDPVAMQWFASSACN